MKHSHPFDLPEWMARVFPGLCLGGHLLNQWTVGLRFAIGFGHVYRAEQVFRAVSDASPRIVLAGEESSWEGDPHRWFSLFALPNLLHGPSPAPEVHSASYVLPGGDEEEDRYILSWAVLAPAQVASERLFQAIAHQERGGTPSVRGQVYIIDPFAELLFWMYDDRGMEVIGSSQDSLRQLENRFGPWIIERRLETEPGTLRWNSR